MAYSFKGKKNSLIWDGSDAGITEKQYETKCPCCSNTISYSVRDSASIIQLDESLINYLDGNRVISLSNGIHEIKKGLPAYVVPSSCDHCGSQVWIIVGMKEIQPQRYEIYYKSVVYQDSEE